MEGLNNNVDLKKNVIANIMAIRGEIALLGANDSEFSILDDLVKKLNTGEYTPKEALEKAHLLKNSKQDYH
jgi:hypothetical protein